MSVELVTYSCGHTGKVYIKGNARRRQYVVNRYAQYEVCPDCEKKQRDEYNAQAARENALAGYPELTGTPKQIAWAESIRKEAFEKMQQKIEEAPSERTPEQDAFRVRGYSRAFDEMQEETRAEYFIDHRDRLVDTFIQRGRKYMQEIESGSAGEPRTPEVFGDADEVAILRTTRGVVSLTYRKDENFIATVKSVGCRWHSGEWVRPVTPGCKSLADAAAHVANALITSGFAVSVSDPIVKDMLANGTWTPINEREFIFNLVYDELQFCGDSEVLEIATGIPGARRVYGRVCVPLSSGQIALDVAESYGFAIDARAQDEIDKVISRERSAIAPKKIAKTQPAGLKEMRRKDDLSDLVDQPV